ncbi:MAG: hypothetical protein QXT45_04425 [Candidatus Bilamarchaeaceae archaeon]
MTKLIRWLALGYLFDRTQGKASQEALRSFSEGAVWAFELLANFESLNGPREEVRDEVRETE